MKGNTLKILFTKHWERQYSENTQIIALRYSPVALVKQTGRRLAQKEG